MVTKFKKKVNIERKTVDTEDLIRFILLEATDDDKKNELLKKVLDFLDYDFEKDVFFEEDTAHESYSYINFFEDIPEKIVDKSYFLSFIDKLSQYRKDIPHSTLIGATLSCLSYPLIYSTKVSDHKKGKPFSPGIFFAGEMGSGSGKSHFLNLFLDIFKKKAIEKNKKNDGLHSFNTEILMPFNNATTAGVEKQLQKKQASFFGLMGSEKSLLNAIFFSGQGAGIQGDYSLYMYGWDGDFNHTARGTREFDPRIVSCVICLFTQKGAIYDILKQSNEDGFSFRFLFSNEPRKGSEKIEKEARIFIESALKKDLNQFFHYVFSLMEKIDLKAQKSKNTTLHQYWENLILVHPDQNCEESKLIIEKIEKESFEKSEFFEEKGDTATASFYGKMILHVLKIANTIHFFEQAFVDKEEKIHYLSSFDLTLAYFLFQKYAELFVRFYEENNLTSYFNQCQVIKNILKEKRNFKLDRDKLARAAFRKVPFLHMRTKDKKSYRFAMECIDKMLFDKQLIFDEKKQRIIINED